MMERHETLIEKWHREYENDPEYRAEGLATDTIDQVIGKLLAMGKSQTWLAEQLDVERQRVSRMLNAPPNLTLLSIARLSIALGTTPKIIFDSQAFYIRPLADPLSYEEFKTDAAAMQADAADTIGKGAPKGVYENAAA